MRHRMFRFALAAACVLGLGLNPAPGADAAKGKAAFMKYGCWQCHGIEGQGSSATSLGKVLAPDPMPLETMVAFVRSTKRTMPPYSEQVLPNEDLANIHAYLASVPKAKDHKSIPLLSQ